MEQLKQENSGAEWTVEEECGVCRITYSTYSKFPPMPSAQALNVETGEFFPFERVSQAENRLCHGRSPGLRVGMQLSRTLRESLRSAVQTARQ
ncbi:hypothetical protein HDG40_000029 [Paraburkholderia sp. JPY158]|uniref:Uncharacterized protein n=1 Tax=Paraburkholderia atlantica TaxID=2654982 RepID=A0A7W8Q185_PARAM|nr:hypothetical protein [Paraburkholderia atlantica]